MNRSRQGSRGRPRVTFSTLEKLFAAAREQCLAEYRNAAGCEWQPIEDWKSTGYRCDIDPDTPAGQAYIQLQRKRESEAQQLYKRLRKVYGEAKDLAKRRWEEERRARRERDKAWDPFSYTYTEMWLVHWVDRVDSVPAYWLDGPNGARLPADFEIEPWGEDLDRALTGRELIAHEVCLAVMCAYDPYCRPPKNAEDALKKVSLAACLHKLDEYHRVDRKGVPVPTDSGSAKVTARFAAIMSLLNGNRPQGVTTKSTVAEAIESETRAMREALKKEFANRRWYGVSHDDLVLDKWRHRRFSN